MTASAWAAIRSPVSMAQTSGSVSGFQMMWRFCTPVDATIRSANGTCGDMRWNKRSQAFLHGDLERRIRRRDAQQGGPQAHGIGRRCSGAACASRG